MHEPMLRQAVQLASPEVQLARRRRQRAGEDVEERALAGAVRPDDRGELSGRKRHRDAFERDEAAEVLAYSLGTKQFAAHGRAFPTPNVSSSVPQMPLGRNSTNRTKIAPTKSCQCGVQTEMTSSRIRNAAAPTNGPKKLRAPPSSTIITIMPEVW